MKYFNRLKVYKASNVLFNPITMEAYSYGWWRFFAVIDGKRVFNSYRYSVSTSKHQSKLRTLLRTLNIPIDLYIEAPEGLQDLNSALQWYKVQIAILEKDVAKPRSNKNKNLERLNSINSYENQIKAVEFLLQGVK